ncbi:MAG TPA: hypothetical protein VKZ49_18285 [Polyangiaceae bacterium]|nr:hypothetical protein [Polyangiaceae bacterium]
MPKACALDAVKSRPAEPVGWLELGRATPADRRSGLRYVER